MPSSTSLCVSGNENTDVAMVPAHVLGDLSEVLINRLDQLLDPLTDRPELGRLDSAIGCLGIGMERQRDGDRTRPARSRIRAELVRRPVQASDGRFQSPIAPTLAAHAGDLTAQGTALPPSRGLGSADFLLKASILIQFRSLCVARQ